MTTGRINQVCTSPPSQHINHHGAVPASAPKRRRRSKAHSEEAATAEVQKHSRRQEKHATHKGSKLRCRESSQVNAWKERRQQQCCFHLITKQLECNRMMHKLALIDNCTQVLLPTQALSSASASTKRQCNSHSSQPQPSPTVPMWA
jgi:hypothetical protein